MSETLLRVEYKEIPTTCWKCGTRLVMRGRGLYCLNCKRHRHFIVPLILQWKRRRGGSWNRTDVRLSGKLRRKVSLLKE